jgi:excisionase family DNA binding protein
MVKARTDWVSIHQASEILVSSRETVKRLIAERKIGKKQVPGGRPRLLRADVERIAEESYWPATVAPALLQEADHG